MDLPDSFSLSTCTNNASAHGTKGKQTFMIGSGLHPATSVLKNMKSPIYLFSRAKPSKMFSQDVCSASLNADHLTFTVSTPDP